MNKENIEADNSGMKLEEICFQIIAYSGDAFSLLMEALKKYRKGDYAGAQKNIDDASELLNQAHNVHTQVLAKEAGGERIDYSVLLTHAQDNMMNTLLAKAFTVEMMEMYKALKGYDQSASQSRQLREES